MQAQMKLNIWKSFPWILLFVLGVVVGAIVYIFYGREKAEQFQDAGTEAENPPLKTFDDYLDAQDREDIAAKIEEVMYPKETDAFKMVFPRIFSLYALYEAGGDSALARNNLMVNYTDIQNRFVTVFQIPDENMRWSSNPKAETCAKLGEIQALLNSKVGAARKGVQDVSGTQMIAMGMKDDNMKFQKEYASACAKNMTPECKQLANQDGTVFPLLDDYDELNLQIFQDEDDIKDTLETIDITFSLLGCTTKEMGYSAESDIGVIDVDSLREKLGELSPYYISPANLQYISRTLAGTDEVDGVFKTVGENATTMEESVKFTKDLLTPYI